jgi:hypothetical protein
MAARTEARRLALVAVKNEIRRAGRRKLNDYRQAELTLLADARVDAELIDRARERVAQWFGAR